ncbi:LysR family transcriptional regulator [Hydrogenophaga sp. Root209]|uniref:LysR family transcriptional regulator n=1 Tax=Hydrogenophaga sp. Root209 TaxID=1736490 RepID=UPI000B0E6CA3
MNMNLPEAMKVFVRVAELSSFTLAADQLGLPRASVSAAVRQLETELGVRLLHRTTRRVQMTQDGQVVFERAQDLLADLDDLRGLFRANPAQLRGRLRVDMPQPIARDVVLPALPAFLAEHPLLDIELSCVDRRVDLVAEGFDCVLRVGKLTDSSLIARPLGEYLMVNCASPAYLVAHGIPHSLDDLAHHRLVHYVPSLGARSAGFEHADAQGTLHTVAIPGALTVNGTIAYEGAALAGLGIIQVPEVGVREHLAAGRLVEVLPTWRPPSMPVSLVYPHRRHLPMRAQVFMNWLAALTVQRLG